MSGLERTRRLILVGSLGSLGCGADFTSDVGFFGDGGAANEATTGIGGAGAASGSVTSGAGGGTGGALPVAVSAPSSGGVTSGGCVPAEEICNGLDDDCNGMVDDLPHAMTASNPNVGLTISSVALGDEGKSYITVKPGETLSLELAFSITDPGCCGCVDQVLVGLSDSEWQQCIYSGQPGCSEPKSFVRQATLKAPLVPGARPLRIDRSQDYGCPEKKSWWNASPVVEVGMICVAEAAGR